MPDTIHRGVKGKRKGIVLNCKCKIYCRAASLCLNFTDISCCCCSKLKYCQYLLRASCGANQLCMSSLSPKQIAYYSRKWSLLSPHVYVCIHIMHI